ncbi:hypothetical protein E4T56_gene4856 [Termitomyces sp. T112]|nr:hypothetical protein E4T56_gene4856 [Termitomyces sp. T112]
MIHGQYGHISSSPYNYTKDLALKSENQFSLPSLPPPPYPGPNSAFALPPYETAASLDTWADSYCLPPYQSRTGQRFHPYMRIIPTCRARQEESLEEFLRSLQTSSDHQATVAEPPLVAATSASPSSASCTNRQVSAPLSIAVPLAAPVFCFRTSA